MRVTRFAVAVLLAYVLLAAVSCTDAAAPTIDEAPLLLPYGGGDDGVAYCANGSQYTYTVFTQRRLISKYIDPFTGFGNRVEEATCVINLPPFNNPYAAATCRGGSNTENYGVTWDPWDPFYEGAGLICIPLASYA